MGEPGDCGTFRWASTAQIVSSSAWITNAGKAVAGTIPHAVHRVIDGQTHNVSPIALAPELLEFFTA
jgi:hypothetical protein